MWKCLRGAWRGVRLRHCRGLSRLLTCNHRHASYREGQVVIVFVLSRRNARILAAMPLPANLLQEPSVQKESAATTVKSVTLCSKYVKSHSL